MPVPLTVVSSPYREITRPVIEYVKRLRRESPHDIVTVYVPEYVLGHWWEQVLHNQSALRLKTRLLYQRGVVVASVPYQLQSAKRAMPQNSKPPAATAPLPWLTAGRDALQAKELRAEMTDATPVGADMRVNDTLLPAGPCMPIAESGEREVVDVAGMLRTVTLRPHGTSLTMEADLWDGTGNVTLIWLGRREIAGIEPGRRIVVRGRLTNVRGGRAIYNPTYELRPSNSERPG
jgi:hypothetical protein